jgi:acyl carrier protein
MEPTEQRVRKIFAGLLGIDPVGINNDDSFVANLGTDSIDVIELVIALEDEFGIKIPNEEAEKIVTVRQAIDYVRTRLSR